MTLLLAEVLAALLAVSCASLRKVSATRETSLQQDSLIAAYIRSEVEKGLLEIRQTVVEFYPPAELAPAEGLPLEGSVIVDPAEDAGDGPIPEKNDVPPPKIRNPTAGAVKRITRTELSAQLSQSVSVDSSSVSLSKREEESSSSSEKEAEVNEPPSATKFSSALKALAAVLGMIILLYSIIQYRINLIKK